MKTRTQFIGRLLGLYCLIVSLVMATHKKDLVEIESALVHNPALLYFLGILTLVAGLGIVLGHNVWSGGALPVTVTALGWVALAKGILLMLPGAASALLPHFQFERLYYMYVAITFVLGAYLAYAGFKPDRRAQDRQDRPRLAA
jgi:putative exporter of polyketide antibiotics